MNFLANPVFLIHANIYWVSAVCQTVLDGGEAAVNETEALLEGLHPRRAILLHVTTILTRSMGSKPVNH